MLIRRAPTYLTEESLAIYKLKNVLVAHCVNNTWTKGKNLLVSYLSLLVSYLSLLVSYLSLATIAYLKKSRKHAEKAIISPEGR